MSSPPWCRRCPIAVSMMRIAMSIIHKRIWHGQVARMTGKLFILKFAMSPVHRQPKAFESHAPL